MLDMDQMIGPQFSPYEVSRDCECGSQCADMMSMATSKSTKSGMTDEHKAALAEGRNQGRAVRRYLEALELEQATTGP